MRKNLAARDADLVMVVLDWLGDDTVEITVNDKRSECDYVFRPEPSEALDAFYHPFTYIPAIA